jgi:putative ABC transport system permease protein
MGTLFKIAWRNVWRHGKRTALTIVTMSIGLGLFILMDSMLAGMDRGGLDNIVNLTDSSLRIAAKAYEADRRGSPLDYGLADAGALEAFLLADRRVEAVTTRTRFIGQLSNGVDGQPAFAVAVDPAADAKVFRLAESVEGAWLSGAEGGREMVIGKQLATKLGVGLGDYLTLSARTRYEANNADDFRVVGLINSTEPNLNAAGVFIAFADADSFLELDGLRTEASVRMVRRLDMRQAMADSDSLATAVSAAFPDLAPKSFGEIGRAFQELAKAKGKSASFILFFMLLIAGVGIANTLLMSVYSRVREIGVLRAFGLKPKDISRLFLIEGGLIGLVGAACGAAFGIAMNLYLIFVGLPFDEWFEGFDMTGFPIWGTFYGEWRTGTIVTAVVFGVVVALIASWSPAKRASRLEVTNALRFV